MARPPKNLVHYVGKTPDPEAHPYAKRWKPRQNVVDADLIDAPALDREASQTAMPLDADDTPDDGGTLALPEPPPPSKGDDLRLPNPDRWAPEQGRLPMWFWLVAVAFAVAVGVVIASNSGGPRARLAPAPEFAGE